MGQENISLASFIKNIFGYLSLKKKHNDISADNTFYYKMPLVFFFLNNCDQEMYSAGYFTVEK